jgi:hypothetical protein
VLLMRAQGEQLPGVHYHAQGWPHQMLVLMPRMLGWEKETRIMRAAGLHA